MSPPRYWSIRTLLPPSTPSTSDDSDEKTPREGVGAGRLGTSAKSAVATPWRRSLARSLYTATSSSAAAASFSFSLPGLGVAPGAGRRSGLSAFGPVPSPVAPPAFGVAPPVGRRGVSGNCLGRGVTVAAGDAPLGTAGRRSVRGVASNCGGWGALSASVRPACTANTDTHLAEVVIAQRASVPCRRRRHGALGWCQRHRDVVHGA